MVDKTLIKLYLDKLKNNISLPNFIKCLIDNKELLLGKQIIYNQDFDNIREKYFNTILNEELIINTFYENINNKIYYYNDDYTLKETEKNIGLIDIDISYYANNEMKLYMFYLDFLAEYYKHLAEIVKEDDILDDNIYSKIFKIKFRIVKSDYGDELYKNILDLSQSDDNEYINLNLSFNKNELYPNLELIILSKLFNKEKIKTDNANIDIKYIENFIKMFNKLNITDELNISNYKGYYHLLCKSYKYKFYRLILNYYIIISYFLHIKYKRQSNSYNREDEFKYSEIKEILKVYEHTFKEYNIKLDNLLSITKSIKIDDKVGEAKKVEESVKYTNEINNINKKLYQQKTLENSKKKIINSNNETIDRTKYLILICIVILIITLIVIFFNKKDNIYTLKFISIILFLIISIIFSIIYYIKIYIYNIETFEEEDGENLDDILADLDQEYTDLGTVDYNDDGVAEVSSIITSEQIEPDISDFEYDTDPDIFQCNDNKDCILSILYLKLSELDSKNDKIEERENEVNGIIENLESELEQLINIAGNNGDKIDSDIQNRRNLLGQMSDLLADYNKRNDELGDIIKEKQFTYKSKRDRLSQLKEENKAKAKELRDKQGEFDTIQADYDNKIDEIPKFLDEIARLELLEGQLESKNAEDHRTFVQNDADAKTKYSEYYGIIYEISQQNIRLVELKKEIDDGTYSLQIATDGIIRQHKKIEEEALASQLIAIKAEKAASKMLKIIQEKIDYLNKDIQDEIILLKIYLNLNYEIINNKEKFKSEILNELSIFLLVPINRFEIINIKEGSIIITFKIYQSNTYNISDGNSNIDLKNNLISYANNIENSSLNTSKYLRYINKIGEITNVEDELTAEHIVNQVSETYYETIIKELIVSNGVYIEGIIKKFNEFEVLKENKNSYYKEINPFLINELKDNMIKGKQKTVKNKILDKNINILDHNIIKNDNLIKLIIYITILLCVIFILHSFYNNKIIINIIGIIIFIILISNFYYNIKKIVRTKSNNIYWQKPKKYFN